MNRTKIIGAALIVALLVVIALVFLRPGAESGSTTEVSAESEEDHADEEGVVRLTEEQIRTSDIEIIELEVSSLDAEIIAQGSVAPSPQGQAVLSAGAEGRITRINKRLGDAVRRGETVATIESREAAAISSDVAAAASRAELARTRFERERRLFEERVTARADLDTARAELQQATAEANRARQSAAASNVSGRFIAVRSPISGRVTAAPSVLGSYVTPQDELFRISNPNEIQIEVAVPAEDARRIASGGTARVETPEGEITARVLAVTPAADLENRSAIVVLSPGANAGLVPGEYVRAHIRTRSGDSASSALVVPAEAVQSVEGRDVVFVRTPTGFRAQPVQTGARSGDRIEIVGGIAAGTPIAGRNAFLLKAELGRGEAEH
ncbi:MAG: efflux RND transporter periplasmic adaptor subunit [Parasphingopyxis sp.]